MLTAGIAIWAVTFWFVYGPMVLFYLLFHGVTTGTFLVAIRLADRNRQTKPAVLRAFSVADEQSRAHQRDNVKRAVVG